MSFREKSAWLMAAALVLVSAGYAATVTSLSHELRHLAPPLVGLIAAFTVALIVLGAGSHIVIALFAPKDAAAALDEREHAVSATAGAWSGHVFATGVALALGYYLFAANGDVLFYSVFAAWIAAQLSEYGFQILLYRRQA